MPSHRSKKGQTARTGKQCDKSGRQHPEDSEWQDVEGSRRASGASHGGAGALSAHSDQGGPSGNPPEGIEETSRAKRVEDFHLAPTPYPVFDESKALTSSEWAKLFHHYNETKIAEMDPTGRMKSQTQKIKKANGIPQGLIDRFAEVDYPCALLYLTKCKSKGKGQPTLQFAPIVRTDDGHLGIAPGFVLLEGPDNYPLQMPIFDLKSILVLTTDTKFVESLKITLDDIDEGKRMLSHNFGILELLISIFFHSKHTLGLKEGQLICKTTIVKDKVHLCMVCATQSINVFKVLYNVATRHIPVSNTDEESERAARICKTEIANFLGDPIVEIKRKTKKTKQQRKSRGGLASLPTIPAWDPACDIPAYTDHTKKFAEPGPQNNGPPDAKATFDLSALGTHTGKTYVDNHPAVRDRAKKMLIHILLPAEPVCVRAIFDTVEVKAALCVRLSGEEFDGSEDVRAVEEDHLASVVKRLNKVFNCVEERLETIGRTDPNAPGLCLAILFYWMDVLPAVTKEILKSSRCVKVLQWVFSTLNPSDDELGDWTTCTAFDLVFHCIMRIYLLVEKNRWDHIDGCEAPRNLCPTFPDRNKFLLRLHSVTRQVKLNRRAIFHEFPDPDALFSSTVPHVPNVLHIVLKDDTEDKILAYPAFKFESEEQDGIVTYRFEKTVSYVEMEPREWFNSLFVDPANPTPDIPSGLPYLEPHLFYCPAVEQATHRVVSKAVKQFKEDEYISGLVLNNTASIALQLCFCVFSKMNDRINGWMDEIPLPKLDDLVKISADELRERDSNTHLQKTIKRVLETLHTNILIEYHTGRQLTDMPGGEFRQNIMAIAVHMLCEPIADEVEPPLEYRRGHLDHNRSFSNYASFRPFAEGLEEPAVHVYRLDTDLLPFEMSSTARTAVEPPAEARPAPSSKRHRGA